MSINLQPKNFSKARGALKEQPHLAEAQLNSYEWLLKTGLKELFEEVSPIHDYAGKDLELHFVDFSFDEPKYDEEYAKFKDLTYEAAFRVTMKLVNAKTGDEKAQEVYFGDFPVMTKRGSFIINGIERVVVSQLVRS